MVEIRIGRIVRSHSVGILDQRLRTMQKYDKEKKVVRMMSLGDGGDASLVEELFEFCIL